MDFIEKFIDSDREAAKVLGKRPADEIYSSLQEAVERLGVEDNVEVLVKDRSE